MSLLLFSLLLSAWTVQVTVDPMDDSKVVSAYSAPLSDPAIASNGLMLLKCDKGAGYDATMIGFALPDGQWVDHATEHNGEEN